MKILFISASFPYLKDGIGDSAACVYRELSKKAEVKLLTTNNDLIKEYIEKVKYKDVFYLDRWNITLHNLKTISEIIRKENIDIIHIEYPGKGYGKDLLINILPLYLKLKHRNLKIYMRYHEFINSRMLRKIVDIPLLLSIRKIFILSYLDYSALKKVFKKKVKKVYLGSSFDLHNIKEDITEKKDEFTLGYFGFVYKGKGIEKLLDITKMLVERDSSIRLKMLCSLEDDDKYHCKIKQMISDYNLNDNVIVTGYIPANELGDAFKSIDLATLFFDDGLTLRRSSIFSFVCAGIPVVTSEGDSESKEVFDRSKNIFMSDDNEEIVDYVLKLRNDIDMYNFRRKETLELQRKFSWENICDEMYKEYLK